MKLIAQRPCSFGGNRFYIGDEIPAELVMNPAAQEKMGVLAIANEAGEAPVQTKVVEISVDKMAISVPTEDGDLPLEVTKEGLESMVKVITGKPADAEAIIQEMTDGDALILIHLCDSRKAVKAAAEARATAINQEEGEQ